MEDISEHRSFGLREGVEDWAGESVSLGIVLGKDKGAGLAVVQGADPGLDEAGNKALNPALALAPDKA